LNCVITDDDDYDLDAMEPDLPTTSHMSFVDGRCACCPYGFHIDLDFLRYLDSLGKAGTGSASLSNLQMIHQNKKKLRKSMEAYLLRQEMANASALNRGGDDEESRRLLSMVEREESVSSKILDEFDTSINEQFSSSVSRSGRKSVDDSQKFHSEARLMLSRPPGVGGSHLTTDYDSSSSVSISSGPPSPGLHHLNTHQNTESSRLPMFCC
jgi:KN motif